MSNWDLKQNEEIDLDEIIKIFKNILIKLTAKDFIIIILLILMFIIFVLHNKDIAACNIYYQNILRNTTRLTTSLW